MSTVTTVNGSQHHRLVKRAAFEPTDVEISGIDVIRAAQEREALERERGLVQLVELVDEPTRDAVPRWTPREIGVLVLAIGAGLGLEGAARETKRTVYACRIKLQEVRGWVRPMEHGEVSAMGQAAMRRKAGGGKGKARERSVSVEQERQVRRLLAEGMSVLDVCELCGVTEGVVRHLRRAVPRG